MASLWGSAIAGSILAASLVSSPVSSVNSQTMQAIRIRPSPTEPTTINRVAVMAIAFGGAVGVCLGLNVALDRKRSPQPGWGASSRAFRSSQSHRLDQVSRPLQRKLLLLLHQDLGAANRLLMQASFKYPDKSAEWYAEKVIYDLQRDRGRI
jgi:hypothetical protein